MADAVEIEVAGRTVRLTHPDKVYFPRCGYTKWDVAQYYLAVADAVLRGLRERPTMLQRFPDGVGGEWFYQKRAPKNRPPWLPTTRISFPSGRFADELCPTEPAAVLWAANLGCLTFHPWPVRRSDTDHPDELRIDLDPQPGTGFPEVVRAAFELRALLEELQLRGWPKTSGGRGVHVYVPLRPRWTFTEARRALIALGRELERRLPDRVTIAWWKEERGSKVFLDYNQMARDRTIASPYSLRSEPRATVSTPLLWDELADAEPADFDLRTVPARLAGGTDPYQDIGEYAFGLEPLLELADRQQRDGLGDLPYPPEHPKAAGEPARVPPSRARHR